MRQFNRTDPLAASDAYSGWFVARVADVTADTPPGVGFVEQWLLPDRTVGDLVGGRVNDPSADPAVMLDGSTPGVGDLIEVRVARGAGGLLWEGRQAAGRQVTKGKLDGTLSFGGSATMSVWEWNGSMEADTGENLTVYDWLLTSGQTIASGTKVTATLVAGRWYVNGASCP